MIDSFELNRRTRVLHVEFSQEQTGRIDVGCIAEEGKLAIIALAGNMNSR